MVSGTTKKSSILDQRIASAEGEAQAKARLLDKAERGKQALQADNRRLRGLLAMVTQERDDFAKQLPSIEAVAKLLFTGPLFGYNEGDWERAKASRWTGYGDCLMAAEAVLRGIDEAAEWEYGIITYSKDGTAEYETWLGDTRKRATEHCERMNETDKRNGYSMHSKVVRRQPASEPEPLP